MKTNLKKSLLALWVAFMIGLTACGSTSQAEPPSTSVEPITQSQTETAETTASDQTVPTDSSSYSPDISDLPVYSGEPYVPINNNIQRQISQRRRLLRLTVNWILWADAEPPSQISEGI